MMRYLPFTTVYSGISRKLINPATIVSGKEIMHTKSAQWDTGATQTCISKTVVDRLGLIPVSQIMVHTPSGGRLLDVYIVDIILSNKVRVPDIQVIGSEIGGQGIDLLIGMDIICSGDFAVTNSNGVTKFTFRVPSMGEIDFVQELSKEMQSNS